MTLTEVYNNWKAEKSKTIKPTSFSTYVLLMEKHVLPQLGDKETLTQEDVESFKERLEATGVSEKTAFDCAHLLMGILRYAAPKGWWPMPTWKVTREVKASKSEFRLLTKKEQHTIINHIRTDRSPRNIGVYLALTTGLSIGELCNLTWQDIDLKAKVLHIRGIISRFYEIDEESNSRTWSTKQDSEYASRDFPLSKVQLDFLKEEEGRHLPELFLMSNDSKPIDARVVRLHVRNLCKLLEIKGVEYKDLRHSFAIRCLETGCDYVTLSQLMGSGNIHRMIAIYEKYIKREPRKCVTHAVEAMVGAGE